MLAATPGVEQVVAVEGRAANLRKARFLQKLFGISNAEFVEANLEQWDFDSLGTFDAVFCSGLLYHLPAPWDLLRKLPSVAPHLFIWTHCAEEEAANDLVRGLRGQRRPEGGANEPLSGLSPDTYWLTPGSLMKVLAESGYKTAHVFEMDFGHVHGPALTIAASTFGDSLSQT